MLPRPFDLMPPTIARDLVDANVPSDRPVTVFQRLTLEGEKAWNGTLQECAELTEEFSDLSIMIFLRPSAGPD